MSASTAVPEKTFFGQPAGLSSLFFTEMWERFSYYGMRALLVLYMTAPIDGVEKPGLGMSGGDAAAVYGSYVSLVYVLPLVGGWVADRLIGAQKCTLYGGIVIAAGHFMMAVPNQALFWFGLLTVALGTGLLKPSISAIVGGLYTTEDTRRDAGFSIFYMGINLGSLLAPLVCGMLESSFNWHVAFAAAGVGMVIGLIQYVIGRKNLGDAGKYPEKPASAKEKRRALLLTGIVVGVAIVVIAGTFVSGGDVATISTWFTIAIIFLPLFYFVPMFRDKTITPVEKSRVKSFIALFLAAALFWMIYDQAGSTLSLFAENDVNRSIGGWLMPSEFLQSVNPVFIIIFAPIFAWIWMKMADRAPSTPLKFAIALIGVGLSFIVMIPPAIQAQGGELASVWWLILVYLMQTWAELLLSPNGLSATTKLAPIGKTSQMLALWFLATAVGDSVGGQVVRLLDGQPVSYVFVSMGTAAILAGIALTFFVKPLKKQMAGVH